jgi:hypothetical protein
MLNNTLPFYRVLTLLMVAGCSSDKGEALESTLETVANTVISNEDDVRFTFYKYLEESQFKSTDSSSDAYQYKTDINLYNLVVATFKTAESANNLTNKLSSTGLIAKSVVYKKDTGVTLHRVEVGPYQGKRKIHGVQNDVASLGFASTYIVKHSNAR